ncbi:MAG: restriction endonuclease subunit S [Anaerobutyricum hallii]|uniref:restriction endonuclease subunit S n=1 Tax=Anaerobutyricum hallii TaxID=39488 RepID=UPI002E771CE3|nr:restriction endonuclease subunit S [Anaerobutyricum hallii]MEE1484765.1 restriction endonuclease subunit S [Anaerobutyricum hallii]
MSKVLLGDVAVEHKETCKGSKDGYPIVGLEHLVPEEITLTAWGEGSENTFTKMFRKGNVLFGRRRAYLKKAAVAPFDGICSGDITVIEAKPDRILPELLPFIIQNDALFDFAVGKSAGSLSPRVKWEHLKNFEFELPDMDKQKELAALLWAMDDTKKSYQKLIAATDELVKSQFMELFGDATTNPKGLPTALIKNVAECYAGATPSTKVAAYWDNATIPWMSSGEVHNGRVSATEKKISQAGYDSCSTKMVPANSVVIALAGQGKTRGTVAITEIELCTNQSLCCIIPNSSVISDYLYYHLKLRYEEMRNLAGIAEGRGGLNLKLIQGIRILVPSKAAQEEFVAFARQSDKSKFELEQALAELTATYKRIIAENLG